MEVAVTWPQLNPPGNIPADQAYPIKLVEHMAESFGWGNGEAGSDYVRQAFPVCAARLDSAMRWRALLAAAGRIKGVRVANANSTDIQMAKLLTSKLRPRWCRLLNRLRSDITSNARNYLQQRMQSNPAAFDYEFNTPTVRWWMNAPEGFSLSLSSSAGAIGLAGSLAAMSIEFVATQFFERRGIPPGNTELAELIGVVFIGSLLLIVGIYFLYYHLTRYLRRVSDPVRTRLDEWNHAATAKLRYYLSIPPMSTWLLPTIMISVITLPLVWRHPSVFLPIGLAGILELLRGAHRHYITMIGTLVASMIAWTAVGSWQQAPDAFMIGWIALWGILNIAYFGSSAGGKTAQLLLKSRKHNRAAHLVDSAVFFGIYAIGIAWLLLRIAGYTIT